MHTFTHTHPGKWKYNIHACMTFRLKLLGKWSLCGRVMLSVRDTVDVSQPATLAFTPFLTLLSLSSNRALRIVLAVRRDSYLHLSPHSLHLHRRPPRTAWPWITGAACTQRGPSRASGSRRSSEQCRQRCQQPQCPSECQPLSLRAAHIRCLPREGAESVEEYVVQIKK